MAYRTITELAERLVELTEDLDRSPMHGLALELRERIATQLELSRALERRAQELSAELGGSGSSSSAVHIDAPGVEPEQISKAIQAEFGGREWTPWTRPEDIEELEDGTLVLVLVRWNPEEVGDPDARSIELARVDDELGALRFESCGGFVALSGWPQLLGWLPTPSPHS